MKIKLALVTFVLLATTAHAIPLPVARQEVINKYIDDLEDRDYQDIVQLFEKDGTVISTGKGKMDAKEFYYSFLPNIKNAYTELDRVFTATPETDVMAARFYFHYYMKDGTQGKGEYIDEFIFAENSTKLKEVYMFENLNF